MCHLLFTECTDCGFVFTIRNVVFNGAQGIFKLGAVDEQFNYVSNNSGFEQVGSNEEFKEHLQNNLGVDKSGYLYIYVSNETPNISVFFDNLQVTHTKGPLIEENHYYPFGLAMAGISNRVLILNRGGPNRIKYNGYEQQREEFSDGSGLEWYDYKHRFYDNQICRFFVQDRLATDYVYYSPYQFAGNEVPNAIDLDGLEPVRQIVDLATKTAQNPKGPAAVALGVVIGTGTFAKKAGEGLLNLFKDPPSLTTGANIERGVNIGLEVAQRVDQIQNGSTMEKSAAITESVLDAVGIGMGARSTIGALTPKLTLFRAVSPAERADIPVNGIRLGPSGYSTGKLFATSAEDAAQFGKNNFQLDGIPNTIIKVEVPNSVKKTAQLWRWMG